jgi:hypothetical protein
VTHRTLIVLLILLPPTFSQAGERERTASVWRALVEHRLLSPKQMSCSYLLEREDSTDRLVKVGVYERHDARCGGDPEMTHRLFDLELSPRSQVLRWDNNPDQEMRRVPLRPRR